MEKRKIKDAQKNTVNFPFFITKDGGKSINSIVSIPFIGEKDLVGGEGIPEYMIVVKEDNNGSVTTAHYDLVDVSSEFITDNNDPINN